MSNELKERVMDSLSDSWQATLAVARKSGINWYHTLAILTELKYEGKVEKIEHGKSKIWRLKAQPQESTKQNGY